MIDIILVVLCFVTGFYFGRRSLLAGLCFVIATGYFYGILRANLLSSLTYFLFDSAVLGFYLAQIPMLFSSKYAGQSTAIKIWVLILILWPCILFLLPVQDYFVQLVGLRGNIFLVPFLIFGALLERRDSYKLALWLGLLNLTAFAIAIAEYFLGVPRFFPLNPVTEIIYRGSDLVEYSAFRIPSTFGNAHAYAGAMAVTLPFLVGALFQKTTSHRHAIFLGLSIAAALLGILMAAARVHFIIAFILAVVTTFTIRGKFVHYLGWLIMIIGIASVVSSEERLQRFMTLRDTDYVMERIRGSVNMTFFELAYNYPLGNGMGGGGTSLPYFLYDRVKKPVTMENEYARIVLEQGIIGLYLWVLFIIWLLMRSRMNREQDAWFLGKRLGSVAVACYFVTGLIGTGLFTSIPQTCLLFLSAGWILSTSDVDVKLSSTAVQRKISAGGPEPAN